MIRVGYDGTVTLEVPHDSLKDSLERLKDMLLKGQTKTRHGGINGAGT